MIIKLDGIDLDSIKYYNCLVDGSILASGVVSTNRLTEIQLDIDNEEHTIELELAKSADKKENEAMFSIFWSFITFFSSDIRSNYFTIYHGLHEAVKIKGNDLSDRIINLRVAVPSSNKLNYSIEPDIMEESLDIMKESNINPKYLERSYKRYKSLSIAIAAVLVLIGTVLLFTSNREPHLYRTIGIGAYFAICGMMGYMRRSRIAKKQYEQNR